MKERAKPSVPMFLDSGPPGHTRVRLCFYLLIGKRLIGTEDDKRSFLPVLLEGTSETSFPDLLQGRVYADFRNEKEYFRTAFDLILSLYQLSPTHPAVAESRESLASRTP